ncbi:MAG: hypothetical protein QOE96_1055 [Blastocatellia bacterium]|nr:hypothetical protein [Blastocatellia bacterium]
MPSRLIRSAFIILMLCLCACSTETVKSLRDLSQLRQQLIDRYHEQDISANQNSRFLFITFVNSPLNQKNQIDRARRAQDTATFTALNYPAIKGIESIEISFVASESRFFVYRYTRNLGSFLFDRNGVAEDSRGFKEDPRRPVLRFNSVRNETDVSITRLQLEGDTTQGIALVPHFSFKGNVNDANRSAPDSVVFDFASYAARKLFPGDASLDIRCDEIVVFSGNAHLLLPDSASQGSTAQFLTAQIPVAQFSMIGKAHQVNLKLGNKNFALSPEDIDALRALISYLSLPHGDTR